MFSSSHTSLKPCGSSVSLHLRRPSPFCAARLAPPFTDPPRPEALADELDVLRLLDNISDHFTAVPRTSPDILESLLLLPMEIDAITPMINIHSATLYLSFHPLFTTSEMHSSGPLDSQSSRLLHIVAHSATVVISHFAKLNDENRVISVWMAAERVLEAGLVWAYYLMHQRRTAATVGHTFSSLSTRAAVSPILKVCTLLASFTARWKNGLAYMESWEIFVELLWNMV